MNQYKLGEHESYITQDHVYLDEQQSNNRNKEKNDWNEHELDCTFYQNLAIVSLPWRRYHY